MIINKIRSYILSQTTHGHERSVRAKRNMIYSLGLQGVTIVIGFVFVPLLLDYLDQERYGIWLTLAAILGWFEFFNIGLGNGLRNMFTEALAKGEHKLARIYVSTAYALISLIFLTILFIFLFVNQFLNWDVILNTTLVSENELSRLALIVFSFFILRFIFKLIRIILLADQRPAASDIFPPLGNIIILIVIIILMKTTEEGSLIVLGFLLSAVPVFLLVFASFFLFRTRYKKYRPTFKYVNLSYTKNLMRLGGKFFLIQISAVVIFTTSNIIITQFLGPEDVTVYNIAFKYFQIPILVFAIVMTPIWSAVTDADAKEDIKWLKNTLRKLNILAAISVAGILIMLLISGIVYKLWIGDRVEIPFLLSTMMALFAMTNVVLSPYTNFINGLGKLKLTTIFVIIQTIIFIPVAILLIKTSLGVAGVMLATVLINGLGLLYQPKQTLMILNRKAYGIWKK